MGMEIVQANINADGLGSIWAEGESACHKITLKTAMRELGPDGLGKSPFRVKPGMTVLNMRAGSVVVFDGKAW